MSVDTSQLSLSCNRVKAVQIRLSTGIVDSSIVAPAFRIKTRGKASAGFGHVQALWYSRHRIGVGGVVEDLDPVSVVCCHDRIEGDLSLCIDTSIDQAERFNGERCRVESARVDTVVLLVEVIGKGRNPVTAIRLSPDAELLFVTCISREAVSF